MCSVRSLLSPALWVGIWDYQWNCRKCNYLLQHSLTITDVRTWQLCLCLHNIHGVYCLYFSLCINNYLSVVHNQARIFNKAWDYPSSHAVSHSAFLTAYLTSGMHQKSGGRWPGNKTSLRFLLKSVAIADESSAGRAGVWSQDQGLGGDVKYMWQ